MHKNNIIKLLELQDVVVKNIKFEEKFVFVDIETKKKVCVCPACKSETSSIHDYKNQTIKHIMLGNRQSILNLKKRRYICTHCGKRFYEDYSFLTKYYRSSNNVVLNVLDSFNRQLNFKEIGRLNGLTSQTIIRYLKFQRLFFNVCELPEAIGIDEFRGNAGGKKFQLIITDLVSNKVLDILPVKNTARLTRYFNKIKNKEQVKYVAMDMCNEFKKAVKDSLKNATIVADKFHYTRLICWGLENVRKKIQKNLSKQDRIFFKRSKNILLKDSSKLTIEESLQLERMLNYSEDLKWAYSIKEGLYEINRETNYETKVKLFNDWILYAENCNMIEFKAHLGTFHQWAKYIKNSFKTNLSNGVTEGFNNKIKVIKRIAYGFRNFENFRLRILLACR